jgi:hypothetical protein
MIWLFFPGVIGLIFFIIIESTKSNDKAEGLGAAEVCILVYTLLLGILSTLFDQLWVR